MAETTQLNKFREKKLRRVTARTQTDTDKPINSFFYPKSNLYNRNEFELLDTIYSDGPPTQIGELQEAIPLDNFWPQNKADNKNNLFFTKFTYFAFGIMVASLIWLIYFQFSVNQIKTKNDTQIVFHSSANIMTDKTADKEITKKLGNQESKAPLSHRVKNLLNRLFTPKQKTETAVNPATIAAVRFHTVGNGDSLWVIANKYYSNPSPENITKIAKANNLKITAILQAGQKLVVP